MWIRHYFFLSLFLILNLSACDINGITETKNDSPPVGIPSSICPDRFIIQTPFYQIYEEDARTYKYRIVSNGHVLAEDVKIGTESRIAEKGDGIFKLHLGFERTLLLWYTLMYTMCLYLRNSIHTLYMPIMQIQMKRNTILLF